MVYPADRPQLSAEAIEPALRHRVLGGATSWTPPLERCLEIGQSYGWLVRAVDRNGDGDWSEARLFEVAAPTPQQVHEALAVLRSWLGTERNEGRELHVSDLRSPATMAAAKGGKPTAAGQARTAAPVADESALFAQASTDDLVDNSFDIELGGFGELFSNSDLNLYSNSNVLIDLDNNNDGSDYLFVNSGEDAPILVLSELGDLSCTGRVAAAGLLLDRYDAEPYSCGSLQRGSVIYVQSFADADDVCFCNGSTWLSLVDGSACVFIN